MAKDKQGVALTSNLSLADRFPFVSLLKHVVAASTKVTFLHTTLWA